MSGTQEAGGVPGNGAMLAAAEALMTRVERALRPMRLFAIGAALTALIGAALIAGLWRTQTDGCHAGNAARAADAAAWAAILGATFPPPGASPAADAARARVTAIVAAKDKPRACPWLILP